MINYHRIDTISKNIIVCLHFNLIANYLQVGLGELRAKFSTKLPLANWKISKLPSTHQPSKIASQLKIFTISTWKYNFVFPLIHINHLRENHRK